MKIVDLSALIESSLSETPEYSRIDIDYYGHSAGAAQANGILKVPAEAFKNGEGWATETISFMTHNTTHLDAPWHYQSEIQGKKAKSIEELPLEWFFNDGVVLNMAHKKDGEMVEIQDVEKELSRIEYSLKELDIVLIYTGRDQFYSSPDYIFRGPGVSAAATRWLYSKGIRVMGIDAWGWDAPLNIQAVEYAGKKEEGIFWAAHQCGLEYVHMERLVNLSKLPSKGFKVSCFPLKIKNGSAGPARVVAVL